MSSEKKILITGGAGFIGSHVVRRFVNNYPACTIVNADKLTYAGNLENLSDIEKKDNYIFERIDIVDKQAVSALFAKYHFDGVIHLAAESHVGRILEWAFDSLALDIPRSSPQIGIERGGRDCRPQPEGRNDEALHASARSSLFRGLLYRVPGMT